MRYLRVKNWQEFQHYSDRNPPWIKLHRSILDDYEFGRLPDASKAHLIMIWVLASQCGGRVPEDPKFLQAKLGLDKQPDLQSLLDQGFLLPEQDASTTLADRKHEASNPLVLARSREERREEAEENTRRFGVFWARYPRRVSKRAALKAWGKIAMTFEQFEALMEGLEKAKVSEQWARDDGRFIPHPASWLNNRRWEDEADQAPMPAAPKAEPCECGAQGTVKVGGKWRCESHIRGFEAAA